MSEENKKEKRKGFKEFNPNKYVNTEPTLDEAAKGKTAVITFGRMNPMTIGHEKLVNEVIRAASSRSSSDPMVYLSHSQDGVKNPLSYEQKIKFAKKAFGNVIKQSKARTIIDVLKELNGKYENIRVVVGSDRAGEFHKLLTKYNGKDYNYKNISIEDAGHRDPDAEGVAGMSASKMRGYAKDGDFNNFKKGLPKKLQKDAQEVLSAVRDGMNLAEALEEIDNALVEVLDREARRKRSIAMRRVKHKLARGRERAKKKKATTDVLKQRAQKAAVKALKDKFAKNKRYADMDIAQKMVVDKKIAKISKSRIERIAKKLLPKVKQKERDKFKAKATDDPSTTKQESYVVNEKIKVPQDKDIDDMPGSQPSGYYKGVDKDKKDDRARHFARKAKMDDDNPKAYAPAPGDKDAKTKPSTFTKKYKKMFGEDNDWVCGQCYADPCVCEGDIHEMWGKNVTKRPHMLMDRNNKVKYDKRFKMYAKKDDPNDPTDVLMDDEKLKEATLGEIDSLVDILDLMESTESYIELEEKQIEGLKKKADKTGMPYSILKKVYDRGMAAWRTGHRPGTTPQQWAMARVNSFVTKSPGTWGKADKDLAGKVREEAGMPADTDYEKARRKAIKNVDTEPEIKEQRKSFKSFREAAGEEGTDKLVRKYKKDTPDA